ncbi:MAG TPA: TlpA disulfide reductase family protein [Candidatus Sulfotelmatobacter sp.]
MKLRSFRGMVLGIVLAIAILAIPSTLPAEVIAANARKAAPEFDLKDSKGTRVHLPDFKGKVVLLNFWATWCHGCQTEIPWFMEFQSEFRHDGLAIVGVSMDDDGWKSVTPFIEEKKLNYTVVIGDEALGKLYGLGPMPKTVLIDRDGKIAATYDGVVEKAGCESDIRALLRDDARNSAK